MAFAKLRSLGEQKFAALLGELANGKAPLVVARIVIHEWGDFKDCSETLLAMQLHRMKKHMALGKLGRRLQSQTEGGVKADIRKLKSPNLDCFQSLVGLARMQEMRVQALWEREMATNKPCPSLNNAVIAYRDLLLCVRRMKVELGIEEELEGLRSVHRAFGNDEEIERATAERRFNDAIAAVTKIFEKRGIASTVRCN